MPDHITGTLVQSFFTCKRQAWLMAHELNPRQDFEFLELGRLVHDDSYKRTRKEIVVGDMRLDLVREHNGKILVGEVKKSSRNLLAATMQLCFYLKQLNDMGVEATGQLFFPEERKKIPIEVVPEHNQQLEETLADIQFLVALSAPPPYVRGKFCAHCAYLEFCAS